MNSYRRGLRNGVLVNPELFILEKVNLAPPTIGWSNLVKLGQTWSNLVKLGQTWSNLLKNLYYFVRVVTREELQWIENDVSSLDFRIFAKTMEVNVWKLEIN